MDFFGIIVGIAGGIVCVGLLTLVLWRVFATISDRRQFARFERERQNMKESCTNIGLDAT